MSPAIRAKTPASHPAVHEIVAWAFGQEGEALPWGGLTRLAEALHPR